MTFWESDEWRAYEAATWDAPGTRARLLASAAWTTRVLALDRPEAELWRGVRRSYHALIHRLERDAGLSVSEARTASDFLGVCRPLHLAEAGRDTRPLASWLVQGDWVDARAARCFVASRGSRPVGFAFVSVYERWAYYFSAASTERDVQHLIQWHAISELRSAGVLCYELGWMDKDGDSEKDRQIAFFKRGFGGFDVPARLSGREEMLDGCRV